MAELEKQEPSASLGGSSTSAAPEKLSPVEDIKARSNYLRGTIAEDLAGDSPQFAKDNQQLLKFHGTYQQDDRDARAASRAAGGAKADKSFIFMVRTRIPGGKLTSAQLLAELDLADEIGNTTLRITTRQGLQLHGILKQDLQQCIRRINQVQLSTLAACGDVERNVMCCPAPYRQDPVHDELQRLADRLAEHLAPRTAAYHELWLRDPATGEEHLAGGGNGQEVEPIYGPTYLPRKFKTAIALPGDNCVDLLANDLGFLAICRDFRVTGYNVFVGGGMGVTPSAAKTFPALAQPLCFARPEEAVAVAEAVIKVQRDFGNRGDRKVARLKYLLADRGLDWFRARVAEYLGQPLEPCAPDSIHGFDDHLGWFEQGDGHWCYGLNVENGRIKDEGPFRLKAALREIATRIAPNLRLTAHQSLLFCDVREQDRGTIEATLREHGVKLSHEISTLRRWSMACVAWPTCGLSITESERALPGIIDRLEPELARLGLSSEAFTVRMTGCPNGCARPYNSDVGLVGKTAGKYTVFLGGRLLGDRLNFLYKDLVPEEELVPTLAAVFAHYKHERQAGESFGDFCHRQGPEALAAWAEAFTAQQSG